MRKIGAVIIATSLTGCGHAQSRDLRALVHSFANNAFQQGIWETLEAKGPRALPYLYAEARPGTGQDHVYRMIKIIGARAPAVHIGRFYPIAARDGNPEHLRGWGPTSYRWHLRKAKSGRPIERQFAYKALSNLAAANWGGNTGSDPALTRAFRRGVKSNDPLILACSIHGLGMSDDTSENFSIIKALDSPDRGVFLAAVRFVAWLKIASAVPALLRNVSREKEFEWSDNHIKPVGRALREIASANDIPALRAQAQQESGFARHSLVNAIGYIGSPSLSHVVEEFEKDANSWVSMAAKNAKARMEDRIVDYVPSSRGAPSMVRPRGW